MSLSELRKAIVQQRAVTMSGYRGFGVEVDCDELEALLDLADVAIVLDHDFGDLESATIKGDHRWDGLRVYASAVTLVNAVRNSDEEGK